MSSKESDFLRDKITTVYNLFSDGYLPSEKETDILYSIKHGKCNIIKRYNMHSIVIENHLGKRIQLNIDYYLKKEEIWYISQGNSVQSTPQGFSRWNKVVDCIKKTSYLPAEEADAATAYIFLDFFKEKWGYFFSYLDNAVKIRLIYLWAVRLSLKKIKDNDFKLVNFFNKCIENEEQTGSYIVVLLLKLFRSLYYYSKRLWTEEQLKDNFDETMKELDYHLTIAAQKGELDDDAVLKSDLGYILPKCTRCRCLCLQNNKHFCDTSVSKDKYINDYTGENRLKDPDAYLAWCYAVSPYQCVDSHSITERTLYDYTRKRSKGLRISETDISFSLMDFDLADFLALFGNIEFEYFYEKFNKPKKIFLCQCAYKLSGAIHQYNMLKNHMYCDECGKKLSADLIYTWKHSRKISITRAKCTNEKCLKYKKDIYLNFCIHCLTHIIDERDFGTKDNCNYFLCAYCGSGNKFLGIQPYTKCPNCGNTDSKTLDKTDKRPRAGILCRKCGHNGVKFRSRYDITTSDSVYRCRC